jgi:hypothetical protein
LESNKKHQKNGYRFRLKALPFGGAILIQLKLFFIRIFPETLLQSRSTKENIHHCVFQASESYFLPREKIAFTKFNKEKG